MQRRRHERNKATTLVSDEKDSTLKHLKKRQKGAIKDTFAKSRKQKSRCWSSCWSIVGLVMIILICVLAFIVKTKPLKPKTEKMDTRDHYIDLDENATRILEDWDMNNTHLLNIQNFMDTYLYSTQDKGISSSAGFIHPRLNSAPHRRTHYLSLYEGDSNQYKNRPIRSGEIILELPRHFLIWDLDAFRCDFIQQHLFHARHLDTGNALDGGAFLAAFLLYRRKMSNASWRESVHNNNPTYRLQYTQEQDILLNTYLNILPQYSKSSIPFNHTFGVTQKQHFHPVLWSESECMKFLGLNTLSYNLVQAYRYMIISEYHAFNHSSSLFNNSTHSGSIFGENISLREYMEMRLHVISRSFGTGTPGIEEFLLNSSQVNRYRDQNEELEFYRKSTGVDFTKGSRAMSPILDMWDHHASPNSDWRYHSSKRAFIIKAIGIQGIQPGYDVWVSYGKYSDTHLFSKFGFVNGDGSGYTESSIAVYHRLLDPGMGQQFSFMSRDSSLNSIPLPRDHLEQKLDILKYLEYDDGYTTCIDPEKDTVAFVLKKLKFRMLLILANIYDRWVIKWHPRNSSAQPLRGSILPLTGDPPTFDVNRVTFDGSKVLSTCRLITLMHEDYDGDAITVLEKALTNESIKESFMSSRQNDLSELRSLNCLVRLTSVALSKYPKATMDVYRSLSSSLVTYGTPDWTSSHVALGEMLSLESLRNIALSGARMIVEKIQLKDNSSNGAFLRKQPCPGSLSLSILNEI